MVFLLDHDTLVPSQRLYSQWCDIATFCLSVRFKTHLAHIRPFTLRTEEHGGQGSESYRYGLNVFKNVVKNQKQENTPEKKKRFTRNVLAFSFPAQELFQPLTAPTKHRIVLNFASVANQLAEETKATSENHPNLILFFPCNKYHTVIQLFLSLCR